MRRGARFWMLSALLCAALTLVGCGARLTDDSLFRLPKLPAEYESLEGLIDALTDAAGEYVGAYERAAMLHGINIADALREVAARPSNLAELISAKLKENRATTAEAQQ